MTAWTLQPSTDVLFCLKDWALQLLKGGTFIPWANYCNGITHQLPKWIVFNNAERYVTLVKTHSHYPIRFYLFRFLYNWLDRRCDPGPTKWDAIPALPRGVAVEPLPLPSPIVVDRDAPKLLAWPKAASSALFAAISSFFLIFHG